MAFVDNKTPIRQHVLQTQKISFMPKYIKWISMDVFPQAFSDESMSLNVMHVDTDDEVLKGQGKHS
jgi:hypothetical protein